MPRNDEVYSGMLNEERNKSDRLEEELAKTKDELVKTKVELAEVKKELVYAEEFNENLVDLNSDAMGSVVMALNIIADYAKQLPHEQISRFAEEIALAAEKSDSFLCGITKMWVSKESGKKLNIEVDFTLGKKDRTLLFRHDGTISYPIEAAKTEFSKN